jgi:cyclopropane fatty-acyl-phospholipid synthase-like methyltransferase
LLIGYSQIYANTEILSPIDHETWQIIGETTNLTPSSRVIELASGKGAFARFLAGRYHCQVDGFDVDPDFVEYSIGRASEQGLSSLVDFRCQDINGLQIEAHDYDLGACLGALYIFREAGWRVLTTAVKSQGYLAVSDIFCRRTPAPEAVTNIFFEEEGQPFTLQDLRRWYAERGFNILREHECSRKAWLEYYDLIRETLQALARQQASDDVLRKEIAQASEEDRLIRKYGEKFIGYMTFIMKRP